MARNGKIARLPHTLREKINQRLLDGKTSTVILTWLNAETEAQTRVDTTVGQPMPMGTRGAVKADTLAG